MSVCGNHKPNGVLVILGCVVKIARSTTIKEMFMVFVLFYGFVLVWQLERLIAMPSPSLSLLHLRNYLRLCVGDWRLGHCTKDFLFFTISFFSCSHLCPEDGGKLFFRNVDTTYYTIRCFKPRSHRKILNMNKILNLRSKL